MSVVSQASKQRDRSGWMDWLNKAGHEKALWIYGAIVIAHWAEHLVQAYQVFILRMPRPESLGVLGMMFPWLIRSELLHFGYALFMLVGLFLLQPGFSGRGRVWWNISLIIQAWHFIEHSLLQLQAVLQTTFFGGAVPTSVLQIWIPRVELHLIYNAIVFIPMVIGMYYHMYPPKEERNTPFECTCSRVH